MGEEIDFECENDCEIVQLGPAPAAGFELGQKVGHAKFGWRGKPVITCTIVGSVLLTLAYFGSRFVKEFLLS